MKHRTMQFALTLIVLGMLAVPRVAVAEDQPHMQAALQALEEAKKHLQQAEPDKGGHRVKALQLTDQAIQHVKEGIQYANTHKDKDHDKDKH